MTFLEMLAAAEQRNQSQLCVGLDPDPARFPQPWQGDAGRIYDFCAAIIDATAPYCVAYKPNLAFYESRGISGMMAYEHTVRYLRKY